MFRLFERTKRSNILIKNCLKPESTVFVRNVKNTTKGKYSKTVLLPQTNFPAHLNAEKRVEMDNYLTEKCRFNDLYKWQRANLSGPDFVVHDGPPYANGPLHMGHAINKILKDITLRIRVVRGQRVHYVPGWDCHGLPIELKALSNANTKQTSMSPLEVRNKCRQYAEDAVTKQRNGFMSWGIMANWKPNGCYFTHEVPYIQNQLQQFMNLYDKKFVFRDFKPVYWSPSSRTALAEAELEYNENHESTAVYVRLQIANATGVLEEYKSSDIYALTWTTTPWTLVANQALAFSPDIAYCLAESDASKLYILAQELVEKTAAKIGPLKILKTISGNELSGLKYLQPITKKSQPFLPGQHVTNDVGTGLVHTAPAHGPEDFLVALQNKMPILSIVDEKGCYTEEAGPDFSGLEILKDGVNKVLQHIASNILHTEKIVHSYPYDWRTKKPVIIRASKQWFIDINSIKHQALKSIANVNVYPEDKYKQFMNAFNALLENRPYWCISRQRCWGTPIPVFYHKSSDETFINRDWIEKFSRLLDKHGPDCWWELSVDELLGQEIQEKYNVKADDLEKGRDIMDIWFDSGISWSKVLPDKKADLYLEGVDQFTGWFQSSLLTSIALQGHAPYRSLFVHGFAVDENADKMSKSKGNVISPEIIMRGGKNLNKNPAYGVDVLRWWVASHGSQHSQIPVSGALLSECRVQVQKFRLVLRYLLGTLHPELQIHANAMATPEYLHLDKYMLHCLHDFHTKVQGFYDNYQYHHACKAIVNFIVNDVSSMYCHLTKDRLYCDDACSPYRTAALQIIDAILIVLTRTLAPLLPHLSEEVWLHYPQNIASVSLFRTKYDIPDDWKQPQIVKILDTALRVKSEMNKLVSKNSWEYSIVLTADKQNYALLSNLHPDTHSATSELCEIMQVSSIELVKDASLDEPQIAANPLDISLCKRCRRHPEMGSSELCERCVKLIDGVSRPSAFA